MTIKPGISLVIPVFNNASTVVRGISDCIGMLERLQKPYEIIISDDASVDGTKSLLQATFAKNRHVRIKSQTKNLGISRNIYFLYTQARHQYTALFSVDGEWKTDDLRKLILLSYQKNADITVGKRAQKKGYTWQRRLISYLFRRLTLLLFGVDTIDAGSIKVFKTQRFQGANIRSRGHFFEAELIISIVTSGGLLVSLPVRYSKQSVTSGGFKWMVRATESFWELIKLYVMRLV